MRCRCVNQFRGVPLMLPNGSHEHAVLECWRGSQHEIHKADDIEGSVQVLCKYIQMSAAALARRQEATEKALAECIDTVASLAAAQAKVHLLRSFSSQTASADVLDHAERVLESSRMQARVQASDHRSPPWLCT